MNASVYFHFCENVEKKNLWVWFTNCLSWSRVLGRWFVRSPAKYFLKVPANWRTVSTDDFPDGFGLSNHLAFQVSHNQKKKKKHNHCVGREGWMDELTTHQTSCLKLMEFCVFVFCFYSVHWKSTVTEVSFTM